MEFQTEKKIDFLLTIHFLFACKYECECECHHQCSALALVRLWYFPALFNLQSII